MTFLTDEAPPLIPIVQREDGFYQIGLDDMTAAGPFETYTFASAVATRLIAKDAPVREGNVLQQGAR
jgi:hypothetical protein